MSHFGICLESPLSLWLIGAIPLLDTLESLERGEMVKDYNANTTSTSGGGTSTGAESEDDEDPRTPTSVSSQGSQGYDSAGSDFVDIEGFQQIPDAALNELNIQVEEN